MVRKSRKRICLKICSTLTVIFFTISTLATQQPAGAQIPAAENTPVVVLIQEAHANYESQENIVRELSRIYREHNRADAVIALEGTPFGTDIDPVVFRAFPIEHIRRNVSESFLKSGKIDGAEFFAANDAPDARLTGIEDPALYQKNLVAFRNFYPHQSKCLGELQKIRSDIEKKKKRVYGKPMLDLETSRTRFAKDSSTLFLHLSVLRQLAKLKHIDMGKYPTIGQTKPPLEIDLFRQISELELVLRQALPRTIEEKKLARADRELELLEKLASISLTREEYNELKKVSDASQKQGIGYLTPAFEFYALAEKRDRVLGANILRLIEKENYKIIFVITGGFHTPGIQKMLEARHIAYTSLAPQPGIHNDRSDYFARLQGKSTLRPERLDYSLGALLTLTGKLVKDSIPNTPAVMRQFENNLAAKLSPKSETLTIAREIAGTLSPDGFRFTFRGKKIRVRIPDQITAAASLGGTTRPVPDEIKKEILGIYAQQLFKNNTLTTRNLVGVLKRIYDAIDRSAIPGGSNYILFENLNGSSAEWWPKPPHKDIKLVPISLNGTSDFGVMLSNGERYRIQLYFRENPSSGRVPVAAIEIEGLAPAPPAKPGKQTNVVKPEETAIQPAMDVPAAKPAEPDSPVFEYDVDQLLSEPDPPPPPAKISEREYSDAFAKKLIETGKFRDVSFLARGAMGMVFKATQITPEGNRVVAVKTIHPDRLKEADTLKRFKIEAKAMAKVQVRSLIAKIHVVLFFDVDEVETSYGAAPYLVMEYLENAKTLEDLIQQSPVIEVADEFGQMEKIHHVPLPLALKLIQRIAAAMHEFHQEKLVHRDIKPSNIGLKLVQEKDREQLRPARIDLGDIHGDYIPIVLDLGLVKRIRGSTDGDSMQSVTKSGEIMGTPIFMAPEQAMDSSKVDGRADIYALAASLFFMITGRHAIPFREGEKFFPGYASRLTDDGERERVLEKSLSLLDELGLPENRTEELKAIFMHAIAAPLGPTKEELSSLEKKSKEEFENTLKTIRYSNAKKFADDLAVFRRNLGEKSRTPQKRGGNKLLIGLLISAAISAAAAVSALIYVSVFAQPQNQQKKSSTTAPARGKSLGENTNIQFPNPAQSSIPKVISKKANALKSFSPLVMEFDRNVLHQLLDPKKDPRASNKSLAVVFLVHNSSLMKQLEHEYGKLLSDHHIYLIHSKPLLADTNRTDLENLIGRLMTRVGPLFFPEGKFRKLRPEQIVFVNGAFNKNWGKNVLRVKYDRKRFRSARYRSAVLTVSFYGLNHRDEWMDLFRLDTADASYSILTKIINKFVFESQSERLTAQAA
ncbi:MAG: serine/threonine protein kinase [Candidatus Omnitrophica bacterium]|nr:serine/threonine protein kinase [Candidatus Omnitrophota bacterium]